MRLRLWKNTNTLDGLIDDFPISERPEDAELALLGGKSLDLARFPHLRGIFRAGVGRDNVPLDEAARRDIRVAFPDEETTQILFDETAHFTCSLILRMLYADCGTLEPWSKRSRPALSTQQLLVIGTGNIGSRVRDRMSAFMRVDTFDLKEDEESALPEKLASADCVTLHIPKSATSVGWFDAKKLGALRQGAVLVNTARGAIVEEASLYQALADQKITAAFDVFWQEPYVGRLKAFHPQRFYMTPHVASTSITFLQGCARSLRQLSAQLEDA